MTSSKEHFMAPEEAACYLVICLNHSLDRLQCGSSGATKGCALLFHICSSSSCFNV